MKRKLLALFTVLLLLVTMVTPAFADLIWGPRENIFFETHNCPIHLRDYFTNGEKGYVTVRTAPDSMTEVVNLANGTRFNVVYTWEDKDGSLWGLGYSGQWGENEGWVNLADMALIYDYISFEEDHGHEFQAYDGSGDHLTEACTYSYPGGTYISRAKTVEGHTYTLTESFQHLYTDENGLRWAYVEYYYLLRNVWVCIDDPLNENLGTDADLTEDQVRGMDSPIVPPAARVPAIGAFPLWVIPVVLVIAVAVVTAVIVRGRRKTTR